MHRPKVNEFYNTGYQDSGADIAFNLMSGQSTSALTPTPSPDPAEQSTWCFPDTEEGILSALEKHATHIWANTILFAQHPLQISSSFDKYAERVKVIAQPPQLVEQYDDKDFVNNLLRSTKNFTLPKAWTISESSDLEDQIKRMKLPFPVVAKPIRGRGSFGVKVCHDTKHLLDHARSLFTDSSSIMVEEFLSGEEATVSVMPPSKEKPEYWSMPIVTRFNHADGIAPYNGTVAVTANSRVVTDKEFSEDLYYQKAAKECAEVARLLKVTAPIRIDVRRFSAKSEFALFDINMKPVSSKGTRID